MSTGRREGLRRPQASNTAVHRGESRAHFRAGAGVCLPDLSTGFPHLGLPAPSLVPHSSPSAPALRGPAHHTWGQLPGLSVLGHRGLGLVHSLRTSAAQAPQEQNSSPPFSQVPQLQERFSLLPELILVLSLPSASAPPGGRQGRGQLCWSDRSPPAFLGPRR